MRINRKVIFAAVAGVMALSVSSCKKFLNVNTNPNVSQTATVQTLLPAAQLYVASSVGVDLQINGAFWAQYWTQSPSAAQYRVLDQYAPGQDQFSIPWTNLYAAAENFYQLYNLADSQKKKQYKAIALLMQAYTFQLITDGWGDVPFKQALKGQYSTDSSLNHIVNPKYDSQKVVYNGIIAYIDSAYKLLDPQDAVLPGSDDLIYGGNMTKWQKFANTLKLRVYLRMSQIDPVTAQAGIAALYATTGVTFLGEGDDAEIGFGYSTANKNPLYAEEVGLGSVQNLIASSTCIDSMTNNGDPRLYLFYEAGSSGTYVGLPQGDFNSAVTNYSIPSAYVAGDAQNKLSTSAPVNFLTSSESYYLQAEVVARGWQSSSSGLTDDELYYQGIKANFDYYSTQLDTTYGAPAPGDTSILEDYLTGGGYWTIYPTTGSTAQKLRFIITQKWFSMCGNQSFEAWNEWRRTGYPDFLVYSKNSLIGNQFPKRFLYPTSESTANANFPGVALVTAKVWWDIL